MMKGFWKWLAAREFMQEYTIRPPPEQQLAEAVLRFMDERSEIFATGGVYSSLVKGTNVRTNRIFVAHYEVWPCHEPDICLGQIMQHGGPLPGATVQ